MDEGDFADDGTAPSPAAPAHAHDPGVQYRVLIDHSPDAIVVHQGAELVFVNAAGLQLIGASDPADVVGHPLGEFVTEESTAALFERIRGLDSLGAASSPTEMTLRRLDGHHVPVEARSVRTIWVGRPAYLAVLRDLTAEHAARAEADAANLQFGAVVSCLVEGVMILDDEGVPLSMNTSAAHILDVDPADVLGTDLETLARTLNPISADTGLPLDPEIYPFARARRTGRPATFTAGIHRPDGTVVWISGTTQHFSPPPTRYVMSFSDVTAEREASARLEYQATHDALTGLPNRLRLVDTLTTTLANPHRGPIAVLFLDLDNLKAANDSLGHSTGDHVLRIAARRLQQAIPGDGIIGRVGGDEFVAIIHAEPSGLGAITDALHAALAQPITLDGWTLIITTSVGVVTVPPSDTRTIDDLLHDADTAMYTAKQNGGDQTVHHPAPRGNGGMRAHADGESPNTRGDSPPPTGELRRVYRR
ncbi:diguanylate cyclase [uncultured Williamsia sp.]|uniref:diguanylate cyclase domain-containing protein n=1 Tax=uncultured Williamsia sp. TaxID=259311 RepID=UPI00261F6D3E|nr:diguanylate cyclase [uncultured Williamsia sp.]